jgi:hypothetical protein
MTPKSPSSLLSDVFYFFPEIRAKNYYRPEVPPAMPMNLCNGKKYRIVILHKKKKKIILVQLMLECYSWWTKLGVILLSKKTKKYIIPSAVI